MQKSTVVKIRRDRELAARPRAEAETTEPGGHSYVSLLGVKDRETPKLLVRTKAGLSFSAWEYFIRNTGLSREAAIGLVQISPRTLTRRKGEGRLRPDESDRLIRAARIFAQTLDLFEGDAGSARSWLTSPELALGGSTPLEYAGTEVGAREVEALIGRLEHGIPS